MLTKSSVAVIKEHADGGPNSDPGNGPEFKHRVCHLPVPDFREVI